MSNTIADAITKVATKASLTVNTTHCDTLVKINKAQDRQTTFKRFLEEMLAYSDHIQYNNPNDNTAYFYDKIDGDASNSTINNYEIESIETQKLGKLIDQFIAEITIQEAVTPLTTPKLTDTPINIGVPTGTSGENNIIKPFSLPTRLNGGAIDGKYYSDIVEILNRKATIYNKQRIVITTNDFTAPQIGKKIVFDNTHDTSKNAKIGSGNMVIVNTDWDSKNLTMKLIGIGEFTEA